MGGLLGRFSHEFGLVLIVGVLVTLIAVPVVILRVRSGRRMWPAIWQTVSEVAILGSLVGMFGLTLGTSGTGGVGSGQSRSVSEPG